MTQMELYAMPSERSAQTILQMAETEEKATHRNKMSVKNLVSKCFWGVGGDYKRNSSSDLAKNLVENYPKENK